MQPILAASLSVPPAAFLAEALANAGTPGELLVRGLLDWEAARKDAYQLWFAALLLGTIIRVRHDEHRANSGTAGRRGRRGSADGTPCAWRLLHVVHVLHAVARFRETVRPRTGCWSSRCRWKVCGRCGDGSFCAHRA